MKVKFDVYFKKNLGTLCKDNEVDLDGKEAYVNIDLNLVNRLEVNYNIGGINYTDEVTIKDIDNKEILIPFKSDVMKKGISEFEIIAYMKNGDIKASQTCIYNIEKGIGSGKQAGTGGSSNGHTHSNLNVLNSISQTKVNEWNNKADANHIHNNYASSNHTHSNYASSNHTHNVSEIDGLDNISIDLSNYYTKSQTYNRTEIDNKIANIGTGGNVDLSNYYTKSETNEAMNNKANKNHTHNEYLTEHQDISNKADRSEVPTRTSQLTNDSGFITSIPSEYVTESELSTELSTKANKSEIPSLDGYATETFVTNKIAEASLSGGSVDLSGLGADLSLNGQTLKLKNSSGQEIGTGVTLPQASTLDAYTKTETDNLIQEYTGGKKQVYLTQSEYDLLSDDEKNDSSKVYNIIDATEQVIPVDLTINSNNLLQLKDANGNAIGTGVTVSTTSGGTSYTLPTASSTVLGGIKVGSNLSIDSNGVLSATVIDSGMTDEEVNTVLSTVFGERYIPGYVVSIPCTNLQLSQTSLSLNVNDTITIIANPTPSNTTDEIIWSSSNNNCTVVNGLVTAVNKGNCIITATCGTQSANCTINVSGLEEQTGIITNGLLMYFDSTLISKEAHTPINNTSINDAIVPDQTLRFRNFKDDGTDGITDDYKGIFFNGVGIIEPMMNNATTVFGGNEETSIRTLEIFGKFDANINPSNKGIGGIAHQHSPINYSRQIVKRVGDGYEMASGATTVRQLNFPGYQIAMNNGYFHVAYTDATAKNSDNNNLCDWLSFAFGTSSNNGSLLNTTIYAVRLYNRVLSSDELNLNMSIDLAKVNYTQSAQEN